MDRATGEIWSFGSGQIVHEGLDYWLTWYADGWRPGNYQLVVHGVNNPSGFARLLVKHGVTYLVRAVEHGAVWRDSVDYDENTVLGRVKKLPCTFAMNAKQLSEMLPALRNDKLVDFDYSYIGTARKYDWRPENNAPDQMGPQWEEPG